MCVFWSECLVSPLRLNTLLDDGSIAVKVKIKSTRIGIVILVKSSNVILHVWKMTVDCSHRLYASTNVLSLLLHRSCLSISLLLPRFVKYEGWKMQKSCCISVSGKQHQPSCSHSGMRTWTHQQSPNQLFTWFAPSDWKVDEGAQGSTFWQWRWCHYWCKNKPYLSQPVLCGPHTVKATQEIWLILCI